jgi:hypothetical protein
MVFSGASIVTINMAVKKLTAAERLVDQGRAELLAKRGVIEVWPETNVSFRQACMTEVWTG